MVVTPSESAGLLSVAPRGRVSGEAAGKVQRPRSGNIEHQTPKAFGVGVNAQHRIWKNAVRGVSRAGLSLSRFHLEVGKPLKRLEIILLRNTTPLKWGVNERGRGRWNLRYAIYDWKEGDEGSLVGIIFRHGDSGTPSGCSEGGGFSGQRRSGKILRPRKHGAVKRRKRRSCSAGGAVLFRYLPGG